MKRWMVLLLALVMVFTLCACGGTAGKSASGPADSEEDEQEERKDREESGSAPEKSEDESADREEKDEDGSAAAKPEPEPEPEPQIPELVTDGMNTVENEVEYQLTRVFTGTDIMPPKPGSYYTHYEAASGKEYVVLALNVQNLKNSAVDADELLAAVLTINGNRYDGFSVVVEEDGASFGYSNITSVAALDKVQLYYMFEVPQNANLDEMEISVAAGGEVRTGIVRLSDYESQKNYITLGQEITDEETICLTVDDVYFSTTLYPPKASGYYHYWEAASGKTYLIVKMTAKNLKGTDMKYDTIAGVNYTYNEKYLYTTFTVLEQDGGANLNGYPGQYAISPLDSGVAYYLAEVPADVESGPVEISIYAAGQYYYYTID